MERNYCTRRKPSLFPQSSLKCPEEPGERGLVVVLLVWWGVRLPYLHISHQWAWSPGHRSGTGKSQECWRRCRWDRSCDLCTHLRLLRERTKTLFDLAVTTTNFLKQCAHQWKKAVVRSERQISTHIIPQKRRELNGSPGFEQRKIQNVFCWTNRICLCWRMNSTLDAWVCADPWKSPSQRPCPDLE